MDQMKTEQLLLDKKQRFEDNEARRKIRTEEKDLRTKQLAVEASRKNEIRIKIRDVEKVRTSFMPSFCFYTVHCDLEILTIFVMILYGCVKFLCIVCLCVCTNPVSQSHSHYLNTTSLTTLPLPLYHQHEHEHKHADC